MMATCLDTPSYVLVPRTVCGVQASSLAWDLASCLLMSNERAWAFCLGTCHKAPYTLIFKAKVHVSEGLS